MTDSALATMPYADVVAENTQNLDLIRQTYAKDLTEPEFQLVIAEANSRGLSALNREVVGIKFQGKMSTFVTLAGLRRLADRTGLIRGVDGPHWRGADGVWRDVWTEETPPIAARVLVWRVDGDRPYVGTAVWKERAQYFFKEGQKRLSQTWAAMPALMLGKVAESDAYKRARLVADNLNVYLDEPGEGPRDGKASATVREAAMKHAHQIANPHGGHDTVRATVKAIHPGVESLTEETVQANDLNAAAGLIDAFGEEAAAIVMEPVAEAEAGAAPSERELWRALVKDILYEGEARDRQKLIDAANSAPKTEAWRWADLIELAPSAAYRTRIETLARSWGLSEAQVASAEGARADAAQTKRAAKQAQQAPWEAEEP